MDASQITSANMAQALDESIVLLSMLGGFTPNPIRKSSKRNDLSQPEGKWRCLLDQLSWLCDYRTGGKTVTSIAAQKVNDGVVFWFASNDQPVSRKIKKHLQWILSELQVFASDIALSDHETQRRLFKKVLAFSYRRVDSYAAKLERLVQSTCILQSEAQDQSLLQYLNMLVAYRNDHEKLCSTAFAFRDSRFSTLLSDRIRGSKHCPVWKAIRHYIGRLGSWWKACLLLTSVARLDPYLFSGSQVKAIKGRAPWSGNEPHEATAIEMLRHLIPHDDRNVLSRLQEALRKSWGDNIETEFQTRYKRRRTDTFIHAEILVLNHFHQWKLCFAEDVRYVGCSKRSCYCCDLYMQLHPSDILQRPCHGNAWIKWGIPMPFTNRSQELEHQAQHMIVNMLDRIQDDIVSKASLGIRSGILESTTGITPA